MRQLAPMTLDTNEYEPDFRLMSDEAKRLLRRIVYWEGVVDRFGRMARLRPMLAGIGVEP